MQPLGHNLEQKPADPLLWLHEEHQRCREFCAAHAEVVSVQIAPPDYLQRLAAMLADELPVQVADEAEDLFPRLRRRMEPDDEISGVLGLLTADHDAENMAVPALQKALAAAGGAQWPSLAPIICQFLTRKRRHIALVDAILLPIARVRLTLEDRQDMRRAMAARRALHSPPHELAGLALQ